MLGLQQPHDVFPNMGSPQKLDNSPMHPQDLGLFQQQGMDTTQNGMKRKGDDVVLLQSQNLSSTEMGNQPTSTQNKKNDKKKTDNNGVKKKKTRLVLFIYLLCFLKSL